MLQDEEGHLHSHIRLHLWLNFLLLKRCDNSIAASAPYIRNSSFLLIRSLSDSPFFSKPIISNQDNGFMHHRELLLSEQITLSNKKNRHRTITN